MGGSTMDTSTLHFLIWLGLLGVVPAAAALILRNRWPRFPAALQLYAGPTVLALIWVHGAVFDPPNNYGAALGFFHFWFLPHQDFQYDEHGALMAALSLPVVVAVALLLFGTRRRWRTEPARPLRAAVGYVSWVLGALLLRHFNDLILNLAEHDSYSLSSLQHFIDAAGREVALTFALGVPPVILALLLARPVRARASVT